MEQSYISVQTMFRLLVILVVSHLAQAIAIAQQDPMFTKYIFNGLAFNPAYAGSQGNLYAAAIYRNQWAGWNSGATNGQGGAPQTTSLGVHSPINQRVAVGMQLMHDEIGAQQNSSIAGTYAYRIPFGNGTLSLGMQAGLTYWQARWDQLKYKDPQASDFAFAGANPSLWLPNFGAGLYFSNDNFYVGISIPELASLPMRKNAQDIVSIREYARVHRHLYISGGAVFPINGDDYVFRPSVLLKSVGLLNVFSNQGTTVNPIGSPTSLDLDASMLFFQKAWVGISFRTAIEAFAPSTLNRDLKKSSFDSADIWFSFLLNNGLRLGLAYDYSLTPIQDYSAGSMEVMVGYEFNYKIKRVNSPRYF